MDTCFREIGKSGAISDMLLMFAMGADDEDWMPYYNFQALPIDFAFLSISSTLRNLRRKREFRGGVIRVEPNTSYMWHVDTDRHTSINMLLADGGDSRCLFAPHGIDIVTPIIELKYEPDTLYAFNTKMLHTVLNFSKPRYMFSVEFLDTDRGLTYEELCSDLDLT